MKKKKGKSNTHWVCSHCGESFGQWWGGCRHCGATGTLKVFTEADDFTSKLTGFGSEKGVGSWFHQNHGEMLPQRLTDVNKGINQMTWRIPFVFWFQKRIKRLLLLSLQSVESIFWRPLFARSSYQILKSRKVLTSY
ncbi:hypothetical protein IFM89_026651 [Coptis chinensis]|uniref:DNA repair protein RadA n=1 Tax=Coptis chinensis TaxID=261450 RepID=A0A835LGL3_9MAGN|nr:hypothetical protein IFM89_026651 [Coptis chinensis]